MNMKKKNSIKRAQSQARLSFAERLRVGELCSGMRKNFRPMAKILTLLVLLMTAVTGAWADDWTNIVKNSDMEDTDVSCFYVKENAKGASNVYLARITAGIGKEDSRAIKVQTDCNEVNAYDTQFFIRLPYELPAGTKFKISFDYKASNGDNAVTAFQCANEPGEYIIWYIDETLEGATGFYFTTNWQHFSAEFTIPNECDGSDSGSGYMKNCQTFALNLGKLNSAATEYIFDNIKVEIENNVLAGLTPSPVTNPDLMMLYVTSNAPNEWDFDMLAGNVELLMEYFAESNLFLNKEALADMANIAVKNGETAVEFDAEGKSTTIVTEDDEVTVQFAGTKKVLGMKAMEKAVAATVTDEGITIRPISEALVASSFRSSSWGSDTESYAEWDANAGKATVHIKADKAARWQGWVQIQMESAPRKGYSYQLKAKMKANSAIEKVCVKYPEGDEGDTPMIQREDISLPANQEYVFESGLMAGIDAKTAKIVFDFGFAKAGDDIEIYDIEVAETYTGLEVNWDAATKTGTFTMPAYDMEIAPIYAPAAKWATEGDAVLAPTAVEGIIAGTSDAIVEAGTVAKTGDILQGTAMYAVGTSATEVPALTAFSDALPTAAGYDGAQTVYVWYYIKGADTPEGQEATAENTFNDSEICATPIMVSVLSATHNVTFADGLTDWTATPTAASEGETVTLTYSGTKSVKSVTAKRKTTTGNITVYFTDAQDYGDVHIYYWNDGPEWPGTAMTEVGTNEYSQKIYRAEIPATAVGIIFNGNGNQTVDITENIADGSWWYTTDQLDGWKNKVGYVGKYTIEVTNVDDNKWTFTMPDCNVELDIEYNVTYPVTISDGDVDAAKWSATPTEQSVGQTVTLQYTGKKKVKSITIEKAAAPAEETYKIEGVVNNNAINFAEAATLPFTKKVKELELLADLAAYGFSIDNITVSGNVEMGTLAGWDTEITFTGEGTGQITLSLSYFGLPQQPITISITVTKN